MADRYALFEFGSYYPSGGWNDFVGTYRTIEEAKDAYSGEWKQWGQVVDLRERRVVAETLDRPPEEPLRWRDHHA